MDAKSRAVEDIRKIGKMFKGLFDFAEELEKVGSLERAANEVQARHDRLVKEEAAAKQSLKEAKYEVSAAKEAAEDLIAKARKAIDASTAGAREDVAKIRAMANEAADKIISDAKDEAIIIRKNTADAKFQLSELIQEIQKRETVLADLKGKIDDIRTRIS